MLQGFNIIGFYRSKSFRRYETADIQEYVPFFKKDDAPPFVILTSDAGTVATFKVIRLLDEAQVANGVVTVTPSGDLNILSFNGATFTDREPGKHYYEITFEGKVYYSDVFCWTTELSELVKFSIDSADITMGGEHQLPFGNFVYEFYLNSFGISIEAEVTEDGVEKPYGDIAAFSTTNIVRNILLNGDNNIYRFLSGLRALKVNGTILVEYMGDARYTYDHIAEVEESDDFGLSMTISLKYKESDYISSRNEI